MRDPGAELRELYGKTKHADLRVNFPAAALSPARLTRRTAHVFAPLRQEFPDLRPHCQSTSRSCNSPPDRFTFGRLHHRPEGRRTGTM